MRAWLVFSVVLLLVIGTLLPEHVQAQGLYYRTIPIGERAIGMGGAYSGIANDPSATYYNPGGLLEGGRFQILGSLSSIVLVRQKIENAFDSPVIESDFTSSSTTTLPHFIGTVVKFGKEKFGDHRYAVAYSSFEVGRERLNAGFSRLDPEASADVSISQDYRMRWWGVSFAARIKRNVGIGITGFLASQNVGYNENMGLAYGGTVDEVTGVRLDGDSATTRTALGVDAWHFVFRLGALYRVNRRWQVGFMFQPPGAPIKQSGSILRRLSADIEGNSAYFLFDQGDFKTKAPIPFEIRTGAEFKINALTILSFDFTLNGPVKDQNVFGRPPQLDGVNGGIGAFFANSTERRTTPNGAIGVEHMFGKAVVAGGLFSNLSSAPNVPETTDTYTPDQVNMFGASLSIGVDTKGYRLTLGATGYFGRGDALAVTVDREALVTSYRRTKSNISAIVLYVAGAVSVASKGAKEVQEKYKEHKANKHNGEADDGGEPPPPTVEPLPEAEPPPAEPDADLDAEVEPEPTAPAEPEAPES